MAAQAEHGSGEVKRLQRCVNDLVSLLALPAIWSGGDPSHVLHTLLDALMRMLRLDLISVSLKDPAGEAPVEMVRVAQFQGPMPPTHEICQALGHSFGDDPRKWPPLLRPLMGDGDVSIVPLPLGTQGELGMIIAAAQRADFPQQTEALLLSVAASQASIGLQEARLRSEQKRIADELDRRVAERTAELAAANAELQFQVGLLQLLPVSAWTLKPDGTPDFVNHVWLEYSGQTLDFVRSHPEAWMTAIHPEDREIAAKSFWEGVHSGKDFAFETRSLRARDGTYRWHLQQAVVLRDTEGKVLKFVGTTTDIDDQKRAEEALNKLRSELAHMARVTSLGALTASIAHEVNQPLAGIVTNAGTCLRALSGDSPNIQVAREAAQRIARDGHRASEVIARLRALFSKKATAAEPVELNAAAREVIALSLDELQKHGVILRQEFASDLPRVKGDRVQLQQVILNLLRNASDAMRGVKDRPREMVIRTEKDDGGCVRLTVQDAGVGINPQDLDRLFEAFYTTKNDGMGMGLSVSRSIIESHSGRVWATPNDGHGATFSFSIPCEARSSKSRTSFSLSLLDPVLATQ
ncbi:MAG: ATP-binding protein [Terracidiphilus sp.]